MGKGKTENGAKRGRFTYPLGLGRLKRWEREAKKMAGFRAKVSISRVGGVFGDLRVVRRMGKWIGAAAMQGAA